MHMAGAKKRGARASGALVHCFECDQSCCRTSVVEIDAPRSLREYSDVLFYLYHRDTRIVAVKSSRNTQWYVEFDAPCRNLKDGLCVIYSARPSVCRDYDMRHCERNTRRRITTITTPKELCDYLRENKRTRMADKLAETHAV
jgi:Fe-S-cluster containining protein